MKGTIAKCLQEMVVSQFGADAWEKSLEDAGLSKTTIFWPMADVDDGQVLELVQAVCQNLDLSMEQAADAFGDFWVNVYSQKMYPLYYARNATARDFLLNLDRVHVEVTRAMKNARPPRFDYEWEDDDTLIIHYRSNRGLIDLVVGLAKGVGKHYQQDLQVDKLGTDRVRVVFP